MSVAAAAPHRTLRLVPSPIHSSSCVFGRWCRHATTALQLDPEPSTQRTQQASAASLQPCREAASSVARSLHGLTGCVNQSVEWGGSACDSLTRAPACVAQSTQGVGISHSRMNSLNLEDLELVLRYRIIRSQAR